MFLKKWTLVLGVAAFILVRGVACDGAFARPDLPQEGDGAQRADSSVHSELAVQSGTSPGGSAASATSNADQQAYCTYVTEQALAQRDLLRTPTATAGFTQPDNGLPIQLVGGATIGLAAIRKASLTMDVARTNCQLYKTATGAQQDIQYALPSLEQEALRNRLGLIDEAQRSLDALMDRTAKMVDARNATRLMLFALQTTKIKLDTDLADTQSKIAAIYAPPLDDAPLKDVVTKKQSDENGEQRALDKLSRQSNWDVALTVGVHQQLDPVAHGVQPHGEVTVNYNLASRAINRHLDRTADAYVAWKKVQEGDVVRNTETLHQQLTDGVLAQQAKLKSLQEESEMIDKNLKLVGDPDTSAALDFRNQLTAARLLLEVETGDASFRVARLQAFLAKNY